MAFHTINMYKYVTQNMAYIKYKIQNVKNII